VNPILTPQEVADLLGCSVETVNEKAADEILPAVRFGVSWRFPLDALLRRLNEQALQPKTRRKRAPTEAPPGTPPKSRRRPLPRLEAVG
jgi:excisionase family DNA binding protein